MANLNQFKFNITKKKYFIGRAQVDLNKMTIQLNNNFKKINRKFGL